jgi:hypothetical protein
VWESSVGGIMLQAGRSPVRDPMMWLNYFNFASFLQQDTLASVQPLIERGSRDKWICSWGVKRCRCSKLTTSPTWADWIGMWNCQHHTALFTSTVCYGDSFTSLYVDDVRTSQEAHASTVYYGDSFTCLYVHDVRTSQEAHASTVYYGDSFSSLYVYGVHNSQETHLWASTGSYGNSLSPFLFTPVFLFLKIKIRLCEHHAVCAFVYSSLTTF